MVNFALRAVAFPYVDPFIGRVHLKDLALCDFVNRHLQ